MLRRFVALEEEMLWRALVLLIKAKLLDHAGVFEEPQQDLL